MTEVMIKRTIEDNREDIYTYYFENKKKAELFKKYCFETFENEFSQKERDEMFKNGTTFTINSWEIKPDDNNDIFVDVDRIINEMR